MVEDDAGHLWIGCGEGIYRVARADLEAVAAGRADRAECLLLDSDDGLLAGQTTGGFQPSACKTPGGHLWFATPQGVARIDPATVRRPPSQPRVVRGSLRAGDRTYPLLDAPFTKIVGDEVTSLTSSGNDQRLRPSSPAVTIAAPHSNLGTSNSKLSLPPGSGCSLALEFTALDFAAPKRLRFRYRLEGHEAAWVDTGPRRTAFYTNLKPRAYRFEVQAAGRDGLWTAPGAALAFTIAPFYWQTWWFSSGSALAGLLLVLLFLHGRFRQAQRLGRAESAAALARQREHLARDLHDDLGSRLAQISLLGELSARDPAQADRMAGLARAAAQSLDSLVWTVHPERDSLDHLAAYLQQSVHEFLAPTLLRLELDFPPSIPALPVSAVVRKAVLLATKEALHNVVKHAAARQVRMALGFDDRSFTVTTEDDGCGLETPRSREGGLSSPPPGFKPETENLRPASSSRGHGLSNLRRRLAEIGGRCEFGPRPGGGTRVRLVVPLPTPSS